MEAGLDWDLLPEEFPYQDDGCELWPHCLDCPFPTCIKEEPWGLERFSKLRRAERMVELKNQGKSTAEIARIFDCSPRTVQRWLKASTASHQIAAPSARNDTVRCHCEVQGAEAIPKTGRTTN